jgi:hypothetical protein
MKGDGAGRLRPPSPLRFQRTVGNDVCIERQLTYTATKDGPDSRPTRSHPATDESPETADGEVADVLPQGAGIPIYRDDDGESHPAAAGKELYFQKRRRRLLQKPDASDMSFPKSSENGTIE